MKFYKSIFVKNLSGEYKIRFNERGWAQVTELFHPFTVARLDNPGLSKTEFETYAENLILTNLY